MAPKKTTPTTTGALGNGTDKLKQGNLFSFFAKKPVAASQSKNATENVVAAASKVPLSANARESVGNVGKGVERPAERPAVAVGDRIEVFWKDDDKYYQARVSKQRGGSTHFYLEYDDGQCEWIDLSQECYRFFDREKEQTSAPKKRRRIQEDDEDEFQMEDAVSEDNSEVESAFDEKEATASSDGEDDQWRVTDDEEDDNEIIGSTNIKKSIGKLKVTQHALAPLSQGKSPTPASSKVGLTPKRVTPAGRKSDASGGRNSQVKPAPIAESCTPPFRQSSQLSQFSEGGSPLPFTRDALNPAGSHVHNHLDFLRRPHDIQGRTPDNPQYDHRTLRVVESDWKRVMGSGMTDAVKQWWDLKTAYYDSVMLFKTGKFYEMFHMDADVGVQVLGLNYMKGHVAHAGFPEISYGGMADKLVRAGYKVARVEQTETPDQLKERKKKHSRRDGPAPKVVNREVCSVLTMGTRTFCYLDDETGLLDETSSPGSAVGPLLAVCEVILEPSVSPSSGSSEEVQAVCEFGITLIDAVRGSVTIGQFADDVLRSRMNTLLATMSPSEILVQGGDKGASPELLSMLRSLQTTSGKAFRVETVNSTESFPRSTALDAAVRRQLDRGPGQSVGAVRPWDVNETLKELHRRQYYPCASKIQSDVFSAQRWPKVLRAAVEGKAELAISSFGAALFYLQRNLIDAEILSMGIVKAYIPPTCTSVTEQTGTDIHRLAQEGDRAASGVDPASMRTAVSEGPTSLPSNASFEGPVIETLNEEDHVDHMALDGTTLHNLEILTNNVDYKIHGSLWSKLNYTKTPHGARMLRAWLLRPLFRKADIERRADAVEELVSGAAALALSEVVSVLSKCGDIERLLARVHSMSGTGPNENGEVDVVVHPNERAVLYELGTYTKRKVGDFMKVLHGLRYASQIPEIFQNVEVRSGLLEKLVRQSEQGGRFPNMVEELDWFLSNFDCEQAAKGLFEPCAGIDSAYDEACKTIERIQEELCQYKDEMCADALKPRAMAKSTWKFVNTKPDSKDKYLIELPAAVSVPDDFILKGKRGTGAKQVNRYRTEVVEQLVQDMEKAIDIQKERKARGMQLIFAKFDSKRNLWAAAAQATAMLDALGSLAQFSSHAKYTRPKILECPIGGSPCLNLVQARHPCIEHSIGSSDFVPNDLSLGCSSETGRGNKERILLLSGPNMGGKSTLLRQTCLIAILAQIGSYVPAEACELTPIDRIFTRLGASDRILLGQSTFFVELAETAAALRGATRRSICLFDELGRGTSTFDGTAIASATVKHLVKRNRCLSLFATHYHSLLDEWKNNPDVRLGHMECIVNSNEAKSVCSDNDRDDSTITFLYTLGEGVCPKSFGINVARLAGLPTEVLQNAKRISSYFESEMMSDRNQMRAITARTAPAQKKRIHDAIRDGDWEELGRIWESLQEC